MKILWFCEGLAFVVEIFGGFFLEIDFCFFGVYLSKVFVGVEVFFFYCKGVFVLIRVELFLIFDY